MPGTQEERELARALAAAARAERLAGRTPDSGADGEGAGEGEDADTSAEVAAAAAVPTAGADSQLGLILAELRSTRTDLAERLEVIEDAGHELLARVEELDARVHDQENPTCALERCSEPVAARPGGGSYAHCSHEHALEASRVAALAAAAATTPPRPADSTEPKDLEPEPGADRPVCGWPGCSAFAVPGSPLCDTPHVLQKVHAAAVAKHGECDHPDCSKPRAVSAGTTKHKYCCGAHAKQHASFVKAICSNARCQYPREAGQLYCCKECAIEDTHRHPGGAKWDGDASVADKTAREEQLVREHNRKAIQKFQSDPPDFEEDTELARAVQESLDASKRVEALRARQEEADLATALAASTGAGGRIRNGVLSKLPPAAPTSEVSLLRQELAALREQVASGGGGGGDGGAGEDFDELALPGGEYPPHYHHRDGRVQNPHRPLREREVPLCPHQFEIKPTENEYLVILGEKKTQAYYEYYQLLCLLSFLWDANAYFKECSPDLIDGDDRKHGMVAALQNSYSEQYRTLNRRRMLIELRCRCNSPKMESTQKDVEILNNIERKMRGQQEKYSASMRAADPLYTKWTTDFLSKAETATFNASAKQAGQDRAKVGARTVRRPTGTKPGATKAPGGAQ